MIQAQNNINTNTCTFQVFQEVWFSKGSCKNMDRRQGLRYKHKIISIQIHAPFKCSKKCGSAKVAARIWIEDKGYDTSTKEYQYKYMHLSSVPRSVVQQR